MKHMKKFAMMLSIVGGIGFGEYVKPYNSLFDSLKYHNIPVAKGFPQDPWNYSVQREVEEREGKQYQTIYLVNSTTNLHKKIDEDGCTCGVGNSIDDTVYDVKEWFGEQIDAGKKWFGEIYEHD